jgi:ABC-type sugar transport system ATPase subunit
MTEPLAGPPLLEVVGVTKRYGGVRALRDGNMTIARPGTVRGLIGENGSGKSTLLGVLSGQIRPDEGTLSIDGRPMAFSSPVDALKNGVGMVSQETALAHDLTVAENILLGHRMVRGITGINWEKSYERASEVLGRLGLSYDPRLPAAALRPDQRQMVEIARALSLETRILVLDEPTSSLSEDEVGAIFDVVRHLSTVGVSTILVTHRLSELFELCDDFTVLRDGVTVTEGLASGFTPESLVSAMVGGSGATDRIPRGARPAADSGSPILSLSAVDSGREVREIDLEVRPGEIVGLSGLVGAGRSELLEAVFGVRPRDGQISVGGEPLAAGRPTAAIAAGIGYLPPDRKSQGVVLSMSVADNMAMVSTHRVARVAPPGARATTTAVRRVAADMRLRAAGIDVLVGTLSGGNQQKVALGKWLIDPPKVLLLDEPTRGVDVNAKAEIHQILGELADRGVALIVSSSENDELLNLCDRFAVMFHGRIVARLSRQEASEELLSRIAGGQA